MGVTEKVASLAWYNRATTLLNTCTPGGAFGIRENNDGCSDDTVSCHDN